MFEDFQTFDIEVNNDVPVSLHGVKGGHGPPLLLLHGFPQTHHIYHLIAPVLAPHYTLIIPDLRGYGLSSKPPHSASHAAYSKASMAADCAALMSHFSYHRFSVVGHDRGGRATHKLCVDFPDRVEKAMVLDIAPTLAMFEQTDQNFATAYWHWFFMLQPHPFPETLMMSETKIFLERFFRGVYAGKGGFISQEAIEEYSKQFDVIAGVAGMCEDYRAAATIDLQHARADITEGRKIKCDFRVLWGKKGVVEKYFDALALWREVCDGEVSGEAVDAGHYIPEEVPDVLVRHIKEFFAGEKEKL